MKVEKKKRISTDTVSLANNVRMPILGLGSSHKGGYSHDAVVYALKECGYRLIDTAARYNNEALLSKAISESGVNREELFLISKLWPAEGGYTSTIAAFERSCKNLAVDYLDLYLVHWPVVPSAVSDPENFLRETWRAMEDLYLEGRCRAIGVSNFLVHHLQELLSSCRVIPHVNQVEFHPFQHPKELLYFCQSHDIQLQGYSPLAKATILDEKPVRNVAKKHDVTSAQVLIRWCLQKNIATIPKSTQQHRLLENSQVFDFRLDEDDVESLDCLHNSTRVVRPELVQGKVDASFDKLQAPRTSNSITFPLSSNSG